MVFGQSMKLKSGFRFFNSELVFKLKILMDWFVQFLWLLKGLFNLVDGGLKEVYIVRLVMVMRMIVKVMLRIVVDFMG